MDCPVALSLAVVVAPTGAAVGTLLDPAPRAALTLQADAETDGLWITQRGGDAVDVRGVDLRSMTEGRPLRH